MPTDEKVWECCDAVAIKETEEALLVELDGEEYWVPKSVITEDSEVREDGDEGTLSVQAWWARTRDLA